MESGRIFDFLEGAQRPVRTAINVVLAVLIGLMLARFFWFIVAPEAGGASALKTDLPRPIVETKTSLIVDRTVLFKKNFFETSEQVVAVDDAPETNLNLKLEGIISASNAGGDAGGAAYIRLSNNERKRFVPGDIVANGAELLRIEADRVLLLRDGNTEILPLRGPDRPATIVPFEEAQPALKEKNETPEVYAATGTRDQFFANVAVQTINRGGQGVLQFSPKGGAAEFESLMLRNGDILLEVGGVPGTDFEKLAELVAGNDRISIVVERAGQPVQINIRFLP